MADVKIFTLRLDQDSMMPARAAEAATLRQQNDSEHIRKLEETWNRWTPEEQNMLGIGYFVRSFIPHSKPELQLELANRLIMKARQSEAARDFHSWLSNVSIDSAPGNRTSLDSAHL